ncbi:unnamed protein product, partial [Amoebophrya sp. A120]
PSPPSLTTCVYYLEELKVLMSTRSGPPAGSPVATEQLQHQREVEGTTTSQ